jgi:hypothetical protein
MEHEMPRIPDYIVSRELNGETVILNLETGNYFGLNNVGARIWKGLTEGKTREEICNAVTEEFEVSEADAAADLDHLIGQMRAQGLVEDGV